MLKLYAPNNPKKPAPSKVPTMSILTNGAFYFNALSTQEHSLYSYEAVRLFWDEDARKIAVEPMKQHTPDTVPFSVRNNHHYVNALGFLTSIGVLARSVRGRYKVWKEGAFLTVQLPDDPSTGVDDNPETAPDNFPEAGGGADAIATD